MTALVLGLSLLLAAWHGLAKHPPTEEGGCLGSFNIGGLTGLHITGGNVVINTDSLALHHNSGVSVTSACQQGWDPLGFANLQLLGSVLSFRVDLSRVGCGCNLALYLVEEPALDRMGRPSRGTCDYAPYYCDANQVCGQWCNEMDIMEANSGAFAATPHKCDAPTGPMYDNCDRIGIGHNTKDMPRSYGPGDEFTIDTRHPFEVHTAFYGNGSGDPSTASFYRMSTTLRQGDRTQEIPIRADPGYLGSMAAVMSRGMAMRLTYWGDDYGTMAWLDSPPCGSQNCTGDNAGPAVISNMNVWPIGGRPPPAGPPPIKPTEPPPLVEPVPKPVPASVPVPVPGPAPRPVPKPVPHHAPKPQPAPAEEKERTPQIKPLTEEEARERARQEAEEAAIVQEAWRKAEEAEQAAEAARAQVAAMREEDAQEKERARQEMQRAIEAAEEARVDAEEKTRKKADKEERSEGSFWVLPLPANSSLLFVIVVAALVLLALAYQKQEGLKAQLRGCSADDAIRSCKRTARTGKARVADATSCLGPVPPNSARSPRAGWKRARSQRSEEDYGMFTAAMASMSPVSRQRREDAAADLLLIQQAAELSSSDSEDEAPAPRASCVGGTPLGTTEESSQAAWKMFAKMCMNQVSQSCYAFGTVVGVLWISQDSNKWGKAWLAFGQLARSCPKLPLRVGDAVTVVSSFQAQGRFHGTAGLKEGEWGRVEQLVTGAGVKGDSVAVVFDNHSEPFLLRQSELANVESEGQAYARWQAGARAAIILVVLGLVLLVAAFAVVGAANALLMPKVDRAVPDEGCCSWNDGASCASVQDERCSSHASCEEDCEGTWVELAK